jgi:flavodoxin
MNIKIVYATKTKNSKKIAERIGEKLKIEPKIIEKQPVMEDVDLLFIVGGIYAGKCHPDILEFASELEKGQIKKVALITSCLSNNTKQDKVRELLEEKDVEIIDEFVCKGNFLFFGYGHPKEEEINASTEFAKKIVEGITDFIY